MYCGQRFPSSMLSRDHIRPLSQGGLDLWTNVVTACRRCNNQKASLTPEQAGLQLIAVPFKPTYAEYIYLKGRRVLADQMEYSAGALPALESVARPSEIAVLTNLISGRFLVQRPVYLIDASVFVFRAWHSVPLDLVDPDGNAVNALHGFSRFLGELIERVRPENIAVAFDASLVTSYRKRLYPAYKANREPAPDGFETSVPAVPAGVRGLGDCFVRQRRI